MWGEGEREGPAEGVADGGLEAFGEEEAVRGAFVGGCGSEASAEGGRFLSIMRVKTVWKDVVEKGLSWREMVMEMK